ncbi:MAG: valine--tRNA ligase [Candidatus Aenigmarchaeota archaeon]|nr:valine--tRNA ligase [Candidatus Aenigmarchaeota archaeon]
MKSPLPDRWSKDMEKEIRERWKLSGEHEFDAKSGKPVFSIDTPPPYVNTPVHIGHAATYAMMDMFARFRRMTDHNVLFPLGLDRNGLPIEMAAEKKFGVRMSESSRERFMEMCRQVLEESSTESIDSFVRLGISFNSWNTGSGVGEIYLTDSEDYRAMSQSTFIDLWHMGYIYEDTRINNYCPGCRTTIADAEIDYRDVKALFNEVKFLIRETGEYVIIGTTRPELIPSCGMVIFNPEDRRYQHLEGKTAVTPVFEKEVPVRAHPFADMSKGTGLAMMCSAGDQTDIRFFREMHLQPVISIGMDGRMNENAGFLKGLKVEEARTKMLGEISGKNLLVSSRETVHRAPICERSKHAVEFIEMKEFYLKQVNLKETLRNATDAISFYSPKSRQILLDWLDSVSIDWPVSRRRYYATEIPLWYCKNNHAIVPEKGKYYRPWKEKCPVKKCPECGSSEFRGEERVFDTWFDSSSSPLYILKWHSDREFFSRMHSCTLRPQGKEIVRTWLYYTLLKSYILTDRVIFDDVWIHHHIVDESGKKMSKSVGNVMDPHVILEKYGAEPFRLWCATEGNLSEGDLKCSFERIEGAAKTITKLWNVCRFISMFERSESAPHLEELDKWIINETNLLADFCRRQYEIYDFHGPAVQLKHFLWETFASHYIELVKNRAYNQSGAFTQKQQQSALYTLHYCADVLLKLLAPIVPFVTYELCMKMRGDDIHKEKFPEPSVLYEVPFSTQDIETLNSSIWKAKKDRNMSLKAKIVKLTLPEKFQCIEKDIVHTHGVEKVDYGELKAEL